MNKVIINGPIYDMTNLHSWDKKPDYADVILWQQVFMKHHPGETWYALWVGDLIEHSNSRHLFIPEADEGKFKAHQTLISSPMKDGTFGLFIRTEILSEKCKIDLQKENPGKIIVITEEEYTPKGRLVKFGGVSWSELPIVPAVLNEEARESALALLQGG